MTIGKAASEILSLLKMAPEEQTIKKLSDVFQRHGWFQKWKYVHDNTREQLKMQRKHENIYFESLDQLRESAWKKKETPKI